MSTDSVRDRMLVEGKVHGRSELGQAIPEGWYIVEHDGWYLPYFGDMVVLTPRRSLSSACAEVAVFCVHNVARGLTSVAQMLITQRDMFEG